MRASRGKHGEDALQEMSIQVYDIRSVREEHPLAAGGMGALYAG